MEKSFADEVVEGLSATPKFLSSKYHYDDEGSRLFQQIMELPEYYLTACELDIMKNRAVQIFEATGFNKHFNIIELGAGDGRKTKEFLSALIHHGADFSYVPIDISQEAIDVLVQNMTGAIPELKIEPKVGDYFEVLEQMNSTERCHNLILFLGANIGNFRTDWALDLLQLIHGQMCTDDKLLVGFDLMKNPNLIRNAYFDSQGVTAQFNLNVLARINRELGGNFDLDQFEFYSFYHPETGEVRSYLFSLVEQDVTIAATGRTFHFDKDECIWMELSKKYTLPQIEELAENAGFRFVSHFLDSKAYFTDSLFAIL